MVVVFKCPKENTSLAIRPEEITSVVTSLNHRDYENDFIHINLKSKLYITMSFNPDDYQTLIGYLQGSEDTPYCEMIIDSITR